MIISSPSLAAPREYTESRQQGVALVLVLAFLALLSVLLIAFFSSVRTELQTASSYAGEVTVAQLAENTTNIVIGQITDATQSYVTPGNPSSRRLTWCSQPGMIHTYADNGVPGRTYKLYSAANMVEPAGKDYLPTPNVLTEVPNLWPTAPALYVDLNSPVLVPDDSGTIVSNTKHFTANYPIVDPMATYLASNHSGVEGLSLAAAPPGSSVRNWVPDASYNPLEPTDAKLSPNPAPMPVRWMYVLKDGALLVPDASGTKIATFFGALLPTADNPIVGRVAFWTDDETCKLNINTASEGVFYDRPLANGSGPSPYSEQQLNNRVPVRGEFNRYPGHPATVCLSTVFSGLIPALSYTPNDTLSASDFNAFYKPYYDMVPRIRAGGSMGGTVDTYTAGIAAYGPDANRLYSSIDELMFSAPDGTVPGPAVTPTLPPAYRRTATPSLTRSALERAKFSITAYNRSPEVNAFGHPRLSLWPLQQITDRAAGFNIGGAPDRPRNVRDDLLAYCSTVNGQPFYFQRYNVFQPSNNNIGTPPPTITAAFKQTPPPSSQDPREDWERIPRNQALYAFLQHETDNLVPGWGRSFRVKYGATVRNQILTEMLDFIRSGINTYAIDTSLTPSYFFAPARTPQAAPGETSVVPLVPTSGPANGTKGFGRFPTVTEGTLIFFANSIDATTKRVNSMRVLFVLQPYTPMAAKWTYSPSIHYQVSGLSGLTVNGQAAGFGGTLDNEVTSRCGYGSGGNHDLAFTGIFASFRRWASSGGDQDKVFPASAIGNKEPEVNYNFISDPIPVDSSPPAKFTFKGASIVVKIFSGYGNNTSAPDGSTLVQTVKMRFPDGPKSGWPLPRDGGANNSLGARMSNIGNLITDKDTVRSVQVDPLGPSRGDLRVICGLTTVPENYFAPFPGDAASKGYADSNEQFVYSLRNGSTVVNSAIAAIAAKAHGDLLLGSMATPGTPITARGTKGAQMYNGLQGDFDNGAFTRENGALTNKPDDYFGTDSTGDSYGATIVSPNRQVCSPVLFGSLPSGINPDPAAQQRPWQTLLFCPNPSAGPAHPGFLTLRDHVFLDLWTMPTVEPYAISEPFSTAGKVNLNYQIAPFTYITRSTALRGVLKSTRLTAFPSNADKNTANLTVYRKDLNRDQTLSDFETRFKTPSVPSVYNGGSGMFRAASEICDMFLVPAGLSMAITRQIYWQANNQTGDNARESPYNQIYARVTTQSNVYTVHMRVQLLHKRANAPRPDQWEEGRDQVLGEYRGSSTIERYVDPGDQGLPDFADPTHYNDTLDKFYKYRIIATRRFAP